MLVLFVAAWWSPGRLFERWVTALTLVLLIIGATIALIASVRSAADAERA